MSIHLNVVLIDGDEIGLTSGGSGKLVYSNLNMRSFEFRCMASIFTVTTAAAALRHVDAFREVVVALLFADGEWNAVSEYFTGVGRLPRFFYNFINIRTVKPSLSWARLSVTTSMLYERFTTSATDGSASAGSKFKAIASGIRKDIDS
jgi:hypothetical protein